MGFITTWDIVVIAVYALFILGANIYSLIGRKRNTVDSYFLAGRDMNWILVGASLFASNIGSEHFIGLAGSGAASGLAVGAFELNAMIIIQILGWVFLPVFIASGVATLPEYMNKRYGGQRIRVYLSCLSLALYIFTKISVNLYSGSLFIKIALGWNIYYSILMILAMTALSTITGGLAAVIYTEFVQATIMIGGGLTLMGYAFQAIGSYENLFIKYMNAIPVNIHNISSINVSKYVECAIPKENSFQMLRGLSDKEMPWLGFLLGQAPSSIWYWCSDQMMVQRALAAKSLSHAQGGTLLAGYIKILPLFMMVIPGMISRALFKDTIGCVDPEICLKVCDSRNGCSNAAYPILIMNLLPNGLKGLMLAVMLAALMADLTSVFNSASTLFTCDIFKLIRPKASNKELMIVGRLFTILMVVIGIAWIPIIKNMQGAQLYTYIQSVSSHLAPPISAVYLLSILWKRTNEKGAFFGLMAGLITGVIKMILGFVYLDPLCGEEDHRPAIIKNFHYLYFAMILFIITGLVTIVLSLLSSTPDSYRTIRTTFWTRKLKTKRPDEPDELDLETNVSEYALDNKAIKIDEEKKETNMDQIKLQLDSQSNESVVNEKKLNKAKPVRNFFLELFCGFSTDTGTDKRLELKDQKANENKRRIESFTSLNQTKCELIALNTNLVIISLISIALFVFFSIPPQNYFFKHIKLNQTHFHDFIK